MLSLYVPQGRRSARVMSKRRASLVVNLGRKAKRLACLVVDSSKEGFRGRGSFDLRRGQVVELMGGTYGSREQEINSDAEHCANLLVCTRPNGGNSATTFLGVHIAPLCRSL